MDLVLILTIFGIAVAVVIGAWQIHLAYKQLKQNEPTTSRKGQINDSESLDPNSQAFPPSWKQTIEQPAKIVNTISPILAYDSANDKPPFSSWTLFSSSAEFSKHISIFERKSDGSQVFKLSASSNELVGVNKSFRWVQGYVVFEYKIEFNHSEGPNIFFYIIPMQETGIGRSGLIEVGTNLQNDSKNAFSPYRIRFLAPMKHYGDGQWHNGNIEFDFHDIPEAYYSIFGPRINEGSVYPGAGILLVTNVRFYSSK